MQKTIKNSNIHEVKRLTSVSALEILQRYNLSYSLDLYKACWLELSVFPNTFEEKLTNYKGSTRIIESISFVA